MPVSSPRNRSATGSIAPLGVTCPFPFSRSAQENVAGGSTHARTCSRLCWRAFGTRLCFCGLIISALARNQDIVGASCRARQCLSGCADHAVPAARSDPRPSREDPHCEARPRDPLRARAGARGVEPRPGRPVDRGCLFAVVAGGTRPGTPLPPARPPAPSRASGALPAAEPVLLPRRRSRRRPRRPRRCGGTAGVTAARSRARPSRESGAEWPGSASCCARGSSSAMSSSPG